MSQHLIVGAGGDHASAVLARARAKIDDAVGRVHDFSIVLHNQNGIPKVAQVVQDLDQPRGIAMMQADGRLVQHVQRAHQPRTQRSRQLNALRLTAGERGSQAIEREIFQPYIVQVAQPVVNLLQQLVRDPGFLLRQLQLREKADGRFHRHGGNLADIFAADLYLARLTPQAQSTALRANRVPAIAAEEDAYMEFVLLALQVLEEAAHAPEFAVSADDKALLIGSKVLPGHVERNARGPCIAAHLGRERTVLGLRPGLDRAFGQGQRTCWG